MLLAVGISALTLLFVGSAVVVLERFARRARSVRSIALASTATALLAAPLVLGAIHPELEAAPLPEHLLGFARAAGVALAAIAVVQLGVALALRVVPPRLLARGSAVWLGAGYALVVGGVAAVGYATAPAAVALAAAALLAWRRRRRGDGRGDDPARLAWALGVVLALGALLPLAASESEARGVGGRRLAARAPSAPPCCSASLPLALAGLLDLRGSVEWFIATRYLFAKRRQTFISVITGSASRASRRASG